MRIANFSDWPTTRIDALRRVLRDEPLVRADELFTIETPLPHGHAKAILGVIRHLGVDTMIATKRSRPRDPVLAMIVERLIHPCSKLATTRLWGTTTLGETCGVVDADVDELYDALDWLLARRPTQASGSPRASIRCWLTIAGASERTSSPRPSGTSPHSRTRRWRTRTSFHDATLGQEVGRVINHHRMAKHSW